MKVKQLSIIVAIFLGIVIVVVVLYHNKQKSNYSTDGDGLKESIINSHSDTEIKALVEAFVLENNTEEFRESLDYKTITVERMSEAKMDEYVDAIYWEDKESNTILNDDDYLVTVTSKDKKNSIRLVIDSDTLTVIGHIPSV